MSVQIQYTPAGGSLTTLTFLRGPVDFTPYWDARVHDNLSTDGSARERVVENPDILISFSMPNMILSADIASWASFMAFAIAGGQFQFFPCAANPALTDNYACVLEDKDWKPKRNAPAKYGAQIVIRVLQVAGAPSDPGEVLRRFYGISS